MDVILLHYYVIKLHSYIHVQGENHLGEQGVDGRIILRWIFRK